MRPHNAKARLEYSISGAPVKESRLPRPLLQAPGPRLCAIGDIRTSQSMLGVMHVDGCCATLPLTSVRCNM